MLREELQLLQEPGSYVGEVVKVMGKSKVLVKVRLRFHLCYFVLESKFGRTEIQGIEMAYLNLM